METCGQKGGAENTAADQGAKKRPQRVKWVAASVNGEEVKEGTKRAKVANERFGPQEPKVVNSASGLIDPTMSDDEDHYPEFIDLETMENKEDYASGDTEGYGWLYDEFVRHFGKRDEELGQLAGNAF